MEQYISKSALVAEIESKKKCAQTLGDNAINSSMQQFYDGIKQGYVDLLSFINTLEVKEVDLDYIKDELDRVVKIYKPDGDFGWGTLYNIATHFFELVKEQVSETNKVVQVRRCLEEAATTINSFIDEVIEQFNLKDKSIVAKEIQYRGVGLNGDFGENIHRSDDEVIYILKEDKTVGLIVIRRTEFNNAEITMIKTEERFKEKNND